MHDTSLIPKNIMNMQNKLSTSLFVIFPDISAIKKIHLKTIRIKKDLVIFLLRGKNNIQMDAIRFPNYLNASNKPI